MGTLLFVYIGHQIANFVPFFKILELAIQIVQSKRKKLLICGDWNLKFMLDNIRIQAVKNPLESHDLRKILRSPNKNHSHL